MSIKSVRIRMAKRSGNDLQNNEDNSDRVTLQKSQISSTINKKWESSRENLGSETCLYTDFASLWRIDYDGCHI